MKRTSRQRGFALVAALFVLVVLAALGAFAMRLNISQQASADLDLAGVRAEAALQSGIQYATARLLIAGNCNAAFLQAPLVALDLPHNFSVTLSCNPNETLVANLPVVTVFLVTVTVTRGQYGSPDFVSRQRIVRIT